MSNDHLKYLLEKFAEDSSTPEEIRELFEWIRKSKDDSLLKEKISQLWSANVSDQQYSEMDWGAIYLKIVNTPEIPKKRIWLRVAAAAVIVGILFAGGYFLLLNNNDQSNLTQNELVLSDVNAPENNRATITLSDGSVVYLDSAVNGQVAMQGGVKVFKHSNGKIGYQTVSGQFESSEPLLNTLTNPKGSNIISITLNDGSLVWLNAGSSITYPVQFADKDRKVNVDGEAYFEVARNASKPFFVTKGDVQVQVLGTNFNVNAYNDEDYIKVTLLEGSIKVSGRGMTEVLKPGQQAEITRESKLIIHNSVDLQAVLAWKNGQFIFQGDNIQSVMRQLSRWYNVDVAYEGNVSNEKFVGTISRSRYQNISKILDKFENTHIVSFSINGRQITVMPFKNNPVKEELK